MVMDMTVALFGGKPFSRWRRYVPLRLKVAYYALNGRPVAYRLRIGHAIDRRHEHAHKKAIVADCFMDTRESE